MKEMALLKRAISSLSNEECSLSNNPSEQIFEYSKEKDKLVPTENLKKAIREDGALNCPTCNSQFLEKTLLSYPNSFRTSRNRSFCPICKNPFLNFNSIKKLENVRGKMKEMRERVNELAELGRGDLNKDFLKIKNLIRESGGFNICKSFKFLYGSYQVDFRNLSFIEEDNDDPTSDQNILEDQIRRAINKDEFFKVEVGVGDKHYCRVTLTVLNDLK